MSFHPTRVKLHPRRRPLTSLAGRAPSTGSRSRPASTTARTRAETEADIRETLGLVPRFFGRIPDDVLDLEWSLFKRIELAETLIPNKYKELIMVAVHSETRCRYCLLFHTEAAKLNGATDEEIEEAVGIAKHTVGWSAYVNGIQQDYEQFADELAQVREYLIANAG